MEMSWRSFICKILKTGNYFRNKVKVYEAPLNVESTVVITQEPGSSYAFIFYLLFASWSITCLLFTHVFHCPFCISSCKAFGLQFFCILLCICIAPTIVPLYTSPYISMLNTVLKFFYIIYLVLALWPVAGVGTNMTHQAHPLS